MAESRPRKRAVYVRTPMAEQDASVRITNFDEVALGFSPEEAIQEAERCRSCRRPRCIGGCPVGVDIPAFIASIADGDFAAAYAKIAETNVLPAICGRVCPQETQCEVLCTLARRGDSVSIGRLERFAADWFLANGDKPESAPAASLASSAGAAVAVVGSGPASLTCAGDLARLGYRVTVFEAFHAAGGVLIYGIPEFRLPKAIVKREIDNLLNLGVELKTNTVVGRTVTVDELLDGDYRAVFVGTGAGLPSFMGVPGENLLGVYSANEYLTRINLMKAYLDEYDTPVTKAGKVAVVGGGNVAMDAARSARRLGADVTVVYRRGRDELPARLEEVHHAMEEGIEFCFLANPVAVLGDENKRVTGLQCIKMELGKEDASGRPSPQALPGSEFEIAAEAVVVAIGTSPNPLIASSTDGLATAAHGGLITDRFTATSKPGVFAGGDIVTGSATVILAMGAGKAAAAAIDSYIRGEVDPWK